MSRGRSRAGWYLGGTAVVLAAVLAVGSLMERTDPAASHAQTGATWTPTTFDASPPTPAGTPTSAPVTSSAPPATRHYVFPVMGNATYARTHHDYPASDIISACGSRVRAVTDGVILEVSRSDSYETSTDDPAARGGLFVSLLGDDGVRYYGSHLRSVAKGIDAGARVKAGDTLGAVGETGDAGVCHLHFGISPPCARKADWWVRRGAIWPWSFLDSWRTGAALSPVTQVTLWQKSHGCPGAP